MGVSPTGLKRHMSTPPPLNSPRKQIGVVIIGILWIAASLNRIIVVSNWPEYQHMFGYHYLPAAWVLIRYIGSLTQKVLGLIAGFGLVARQRWAAQTIIILSALNIVTVFWKHPYEAFRNASLGLAPKAEIVWFAVAMVWALNEVLFGLMIYYLTRPQIKAQLR